MTLPDLSPQQLALVLLAWGVLSAAIGVVGVLSAAIGVACGAGRGRGFAGGVLGFVFGPLGWILALLLPANVPARRW